MSELRRWWWGAVAALGLALGGMAASDAFAQAPERGQPQGRGAGQMQCPNCPHDGGVGQCPGCPHDGGLGQCPGCPHEGCPLGEAADSVQAAMNEGAVLTVESTDDGAVIRIETTPDNPQALQSAREAAQQLANAAQLGCRCPMGGDSPMDSPMP